MRALISLLNVAAACLVAAAAGFALAAERRATDAQAAVVISVPACVEVEEGDSFDLEVKISNVADLSAWEVYFAYDRDLLEVTGRSVRLFLDSQPNSNVFDFSEPVPNTTGLYRLGAADLSTQEGASENGAGILATVSLRAKAEGVSWAEIIRGDLNGDGAIDFGPTLTGQRGAHIADGDGDGVFDGVIRSGQVAVGEPCEQPVPTAPPPSGTVIIKPSVSPSVGTATAAPGQTNQPGATEAAATAAPGGATPTATPTPAGTSAGSNGGGGLGVSGGGDDSGSGGWLLYAVIIAGATAGAIGAGWAFMSIRRTS